MKKIILILLSVISLQVVNGQNCFEKLADFSGIDHTSSMADIEAAACELRNLLPTQFQDQFKVYDGSFYLHTGSFNGFGYPEAFDKLKSDIQSPYYLLVAAQNEPTKGLYSKFWVDVKLPDITSDGCIPNLNEEASNLVEFVIEKEFSSNGRSPFSYPNALIEGINSLKSYVEAATACCQTGGDVAQCIDCNNPDNIAAKLLALGFVAEPIQNIGDFDTGSSAMPEISDYANELFTVNNLTAVNIPASYIEQIPIYQAQGLSIKIYITKDENVCSGEWQTIESEIENDPADVIFWHHIHKGEVGLGDELLFSRVFLGGEGSNMRTKGQRLQKRMLGPDPVTAIIGALGSAFSDAMIQTISIYYLDDSVPTGDWGAAFDKINYGSVAWSGFTGLFIVNSKVKTIAFAVGAATAEVTYLAFTDDNYSMQQGALDFARVFVSEIIGNAVGGAIGNKLKNANISWFSVKGLEKLSKTLITNSATKKLYIKMAWKLEIEALTSHSARGIDFENKLFEWLLSSQGFTQTVHNFKAIDFHRVTDNLGVSLKTTIQTSKSGIKNLIQKNVDDLIRGKNQGFIRFQGNTFDIDQAKLTILVPEENVSAVTSIINQLKSELDPTGIIDEFEVKSFENMLGI